MRLISHTVQYQNTDDVFTLYHLTDLHIGAAACDEKLLRQDIQRIAADPSARWIGGGDYLDAIARKGDKRYMEDTLAPWLRGKNDVVGQQRDYAADLLSPIAGKCLGLIKGNHESAVEKYNDRAIYHELVRIIAQAAGKEDSELALGVHGYINLSFQYLAANSTGHGWRMTIYTHHGFGGGGMPGAHALTLGRILGRYECDLALMGHRHVGQHLSTPYVKALNKSVIEQNRVAMFVPSYLNWRIIPSNGTNRPVDTYSEEHGMGPVPLGTTPVVVEPFKRNFSLIVSNNPESSLVDRIARRSA